MAKTIPVAAAIVIGSLGFAAAQTSNVGDTGRKCWDNFGKQVRDQSAMASHNAGPGTADKPAEPRAAGSGSSSAGATPNAGGSDTGLPSTMNRPGTSPLSNDSTANRPREAVGLPDCNT